MLTILLIKLAIEDNAENIFLMNSQEVESFFRKLRSFSGVEIMTVNWSIKGFISKVHRIQLDEKITNDLKDNFEFPKLIAREKKQRQPKAHLSRQDIEEIAKNASDDAATKAYQLGMACETLTPEKFLKTVSLANDIRQEETEADDQPDFLQVEQEEFNYDSLDFCSLDEIACGGDTISNSDGFSLQNISFTDEQSSKQYLYFIF